MIIPALLLLAGAASTHPTPTGRLPWIEDDYPKAVEQAKSQQVPLFVEVWAPW